MPFPGLLLAFAVLGDSFVGEKGCAGRPLLCWSAPALSPSASGLVIHQLIGPL
jgi:hypothetical protein